MKIFISDIDDTIYSHKNYKINPRVIKAFHDLYQQNIAIVFASARVLQGVKNFCRQMGFNNNEIYLIASNGAEIYKEQHLYKAEIPFYLLEIIFNVATQFDLDMGVDQNDYLLIKRWNEAFDEDRHCLPIDLQVPDNFLKSIIYPVHKVSLTGNLDYVESNYPLIYQELSPYFAISNGGGGYIDLVMPNHDKGYGLKLLLAMLKLENQKVYYIGDSYNDIPLMKIADVAACVGNAKTECKEVCQVITSDCEEGGVADFIYQLLND